MVWEAPVRPVELSGNVVARYESILSFQVAGRITRRLVDIGDVVKPGELIAELDSVDYDLAVHNLESAVERALSDYETARADERRFATLRAQNVLSQSEYDRQLNVLNLAKGQLDALQASLKIACNARQYTRLNSENPGVVSAIFAEVGQVVNSGQAIIRLTRTNEMEVAVDLPENCLAELSKARVEITLWGDLQAKYEGSIRELSPQADPKTRTYLTKIRIHESDSRLILGRTARVRFIPQSDREVVRMPMTAIWRKQRDPMVWVVDTDKNTVAAREVSLGPVYGNEVSIISGLADNEIVVTAGAHKLSPGQPVLVLN
ncbi:MAG: efflux RND transporter periplasmic adaptor subunit [Thermodesulfobacteriota bacterium]|nr:efflux RND transporter periplasmic adaptor subunit [Thermodesulfobacteriota bacterium]